MTAQRNEPRTVLRTLAATFRRSGKLFTEMPDALLRVMKRAGQGEFRMTVRPTGFEPLIARLERMVNRMAFALVVSSFVVALALLLRDTYRPEWFLWVARILEAGGLFVGSWFFLSIFLSNWRKR
jgi:hypothetical protein